MPRPRKDDVFGSVRRQASRVLAMLGQEIQKREAELQHLMRQAESWRAAIGGSGAGMRGARPGRKPMAARPIAGRRAAGRVNWGEVLASTPQTFGVADVLKHPGAGAKGRAQIYAALSRWLADKKVRRVSMGRYEKTGGSRRAGRVGRKPRRLRAKTVKRTTSVKRTASLKRAAARSRRAKRGRPRS